MYFYDCLNDIKHFLAYNFQEFREKMEYKKTIILLALVVFLLGIASVSASEIDNTIASENANTIELSADNDIEDNLQTSEENEALASTDYDEAIAQTDTEVLGADSATYSDLAEEISQPGNINLTHKNYTYDKDAKAITIREANKVIDGNGAVIDMAGSNIRAFYVTASGVTIKNLTIKNANNNGFGGAIYFDRTGTVTNCNFTGNTATGDYGRGGAVYFLNTGSVSNCNFTNNTASQRGGAVCFVSTCNVTNCNFTGNTANYGGAVLFNSNGNVTNCNFADNTAVEYGGSVYFYRNGSVSNCNFTGNNATGDGGAVYFNGKGDVTNCNFTGNNATRFGGAVYFVNNGTVSNCNFTNNTASQRGGAVFFNLTGNVTNCNFTANEASLGGAAYFQSNANVENCNFTDNNAKNGGAILSSPMCYAIVAGCVFTGNSAFNGGAVNLYSGSIEDCDFTSNSATNAGGAASFSEEGRLAYCNFEANIASNGGAVSMFTGNVENCNFTGNNATMGSAINCNGFSDTNISNSCFLNNRANASADDSFNVTVNGNTLEIAFMGQNNLLNAIYSNGNITFTNVTYWGANGIAKTGDDSIVMSPSNCEAGQNISIAGVVNGNILKTTKLTNENGKVILENSIDYYLVLRHDGDSYYTEAEKTISNMKFNVNVTSQTITNRTVNITAKSNILNETMPGKLLFILPNGTQIEATYGSNGTWWAEHTFDDYSEYKVNATYVGLDNVTINNGTITINKVNSTITLDNIVLDYGETKNVTVTTTGATGITAKIDGNNVTVINNYTIQIPVLDAGTYNLTVTTITDDDHNPVTKEVNITVNKVNSTLTVGDMVFDYGSSGSIIVSVTGADGVNANVVGQPKAVVKVNGTNITVSDLDAGTYTLTVTAIGDKNHNNVTKNATITVNKLKTELTGNAITTTYNVNKDLVITLKDITGKALSGVKVTVDLNGAKTYTTDKNGQVKVSTKGLAPKAYTAKVTFNGDTNYDKSTKDIKVTVKKATPKLTAKKKTFKKSTKTKKYSIVLKDNTGKAIKKAKVTLKVKGKTYKATTNSKGKATFKITKLNKKGTFKATITYKGNKYYNKVSKKANIKVIVTFKTVSKGSKDKATVKEIQQALKDKGYYLTYQGHYLKVDGKFKGCTERSLKEFQKDKGLKVTGKVDEKTAKKLGIL